jgi:uncharacterized protein YndB with AHSA1/START domain
MIRSMTPATFVCERDFEHSVALLFFAFTDIEARKVWYGGKERGFNVAHHTLDFRQGGAESWRGQPHGDAWMTNDATFIDIVPEQRVIYSYVMTMNDALFTVSQQAVEFSARGGGSHIKLTEQIMFIDRDDHLAGRIEGTHAMLDHLNAWLDAHIAGN